LLKTYAAISAEFKVLFLEQPQGDLDFTSHDSDQRIKTIAR
jgi:hypothetical protein